MAPALTNPISSTNLIAYRAIQLQKRPDDLAEAKQRLLKARWESVRQFEEAHKNLIKDLNFSNGELVLVRNSQRDGDIGSKTKPRYFGPMVIVRRLKGGSYVLAEMDGSWSKLKFAAFRLVPYHARCNDKASRDDCLITLNVMRERRELDGVSWWIVLPTYTLFLFVYVYA